MKYKPHLTVNLYAEALLLHEEEERKFSLDPTVETSPTRNGYNVDFLLPHLRNRSQNNNGAPGHAGDAEMNSDGVAGSPETSDLLAV